MTLDFPAPLQTRVINALEADAKSVDIRAQAPHYYALGSKILELFEDDQIVEVLLKVSWHSSLQDRVDADTRQRHLDKEQQRLQTTRTIQGEHLEKDRSFCADWTKWRGSCSKRLMRGPRRSDSG